MTFINIVSKKPLCIKVGMDTDLIDAGIAFAAKRRQAGEHARKRLGDLVTHSTHTVNPHASKHRLTKFQYIDLAEVDEVTGAIMSYREIPGEMIGSTKVKFMHLDILFAKIRPSIDNKKVALVYQEFENALSSTEFIVLRPEPLADPYYIFAALRSDEFTNAVIHECGGDTGRQRINPQKLLDIHVPWPDADVRTDISDKTKSYFASLETTMELRQQAIEVSGGMFGPTSLRTAKPRRQRTRNG